MWRRVSRWRAICRLIGINHLEGHIYSHWLRVPGDGMAPDQLEFPVLILIVSGGHTELILMRDHLTYEKLGATADDASGEAFDKVARLLQLGYPGGPKIEKIATEGNPHAFRFARPKIDGEFAFSFSGIKTAVRRQVEQYGAIGRDGSIGPGVPIKDLAASFQHSVVDQLVTKTVAAASKYGASAILLSGGVSANKMLRYVMKIQIAGARVLAAVVAVYRQRRDDRRGRALALRGRTSCRLGFGYRSRI